MPTTSLPTYSLQIRTQRSGPVYTVMFRWPAGRQVKRTIGPAWTKRGRPPDGHFDAESQSDKYVHAATVTHAYRLIDPERRLRGRAYRLAGVVRGWV